MRSANRSKTEAIVMVVVVVLVRSFGDANTKWSSSDDSGGCRESRGG